MNRLSPAASDLEPVPPSPVLNESKVVPMYLLEMARGFSIELSSEPVLCKSFLPGMDLLVSATDDIRSMVASSPDALHRRFNEVLSLIAGTQEDLQTRQEWRRALATFGLVRWWPISVRERAARGLGPFKMVIDCRDSCRPLVEFHDSLNKFDRRCDTKSLQHLSD